MKHLFASMLLMLSLAYSQESVLFIVPAEISGAGATVGNNWADGVKLAAEHINAAGGILGAQVVTEVLDTQTDPPTSKAVIAKGLEQNPFAILGPIYSGSTMVNMVEAERTQTPQWVGSEAASITQQGNGYIFRTSSGQSGSIPKVAKHMKEQGIGSVVVIYVNNEFGQGGRAAAATSFAAEGIEVLLELSTEQQQADFTAEVLQAVMMSADAIFAYTNEEESARLLMALAERGESIPVFGEAVLLSQAVLDLAGEAANGVSGHVNLTAAAPIPAIEEFKTAFEAKYGYTPDHNGIKGYISMFIAKEMAERVGSFDRVAVAEQLHCALITTEDEPGVLMDIAYDEKGDIDRDTFLVSIQDGKQVVTSVLPRLKSSCADQ